MWSSLHATHLGLFFICRVIFHTRDLSSIGYKETSFGAFPLRLIALLINNSLGFMSLCNCTLRLGDLSP